MWLRVSVRVRDVAARCACAMWLRDARARCGRAMRVRDVLRDARARFRDRQRLVLTLGALEGWRGFAR
jgi:hypothetical protein